MPWHQDSLADFELEIRKHGFHWPCIPGIWYGYNMFIWKPRNLDISTVPQRIRRKTKRVPLLSAKKSRRAPYLSCPPANQQTTQSTQSKRPKQCSLYQCGLKIKLLLPLTGPALTRLSSPRPSWATSPSWISFRHTTFLHRNLQRYRAFEV